MLLAQILIPTAIAIAVIVAIGLALTVLRGDRSTTAIRQAAGTAIEGSDALLGRHYLTAFAAAILLALAAGGAIGGYERSLEAGALAGAALMVGALAAAIPGIAGSMITLRAAGATAGAAQSGIKPALVAGLRGSSAASFLTVALSLGGVAGIFATYSSVLDNRPEDAPLLLAAFAVGAGVIALVSHIAGGILSEGTEVAVTDLAGTADPIPGNDPRNPGVATNLLGNNSSGTGRAADAFDSLSAVTVAALVLAGLLYAVTGQIEWLLLPLVLAAAGLLAGMVGTHGVSIWMRPTGNPRTALVAGFSVTLALCAAALAALTFTMVDDGWYWMLAAGSVGLVASALVVHLARSRPSIAPGPPVEPFAATEGLRTGLRIAVPTLLIVAAALAGAFALGEQAATTEVSAANAGLFGLAMAAIGFLMPASFVLAVGGLAPIASNANSLAALAFDVPPETRDATIELELAGRESIAISRAYSTIAGLFAAIVLATAFLQAVRFELAAVASQDPVRYAALVQDLDIAAPGDDIGAAVANAVSQYGTTLRDVAASVGNDDRFGDREIERLIAADRPETTAIVGQMLDRGQVSARDVRDLETGPNPLPRILPVNLARADVLAGALAGIALLVFVALRLLGSVRHAAAAIAAEVRRQFIDTPGVRTGEVRADYTRAADVATRSALRGVFVPLLVGVLAPAVVGIGLRYAYGGDGNEGWLAAAGMLFAFITGGVLLASFMGSSGASLATRPHQARPVADAETGAPELEPAPSQPASPATAASVLAGAGAPALPVLVKLTCAVSLVLAPLMVG